MKTLKRTLALVLTLILFASTFSIAAQAAELYVTSTNYGTVVPMNNKFTEKVSSVKLYGKYDYINFYINCKSNDTFFFYEIYSDKDYTKLVAADYTYCDAGKYNWTPYLKVAGVFKTGTYYCATYSAKIDDEGNAKISAPSLKQFKIQVDTTTAFKKQMVILKSVTNTLNGPKITWNKAISNADKFYVYRRSVKSEKWTRIAKVSGSTFSYTDTSIKDKNKAYYYTVKAVNKDGDSSRYLNLGILSLYATAPKIKAAVDADNKIKLTWNKTSGAATYRVYRKTNGGDWKKLCDTSKTSYYDTKTKNGQTYEYTVRAFIKSDYGTLESTYRAGTPFKFVKAPALKDVSLIDDKVTVSWKAVPGAVAYTVYRKPVDSTAKWTKIKKVSKDTVSFADKTADANGSYAYTVRAESDTCRGSWVSAGISQS